MRARGPSLVLAVLITAAAGALGMILAAGVATGADMTLSPPTGTVNGLPPGATGGQFTVTWMPGQPLLSVKTVSLTVTWTPQTPLPGVPTPDPSASINPVGLCLPGSGGTTVCTYQWPLMNSSSYVLNGSYTVVAAAKDCTVIPPCSSNGQASTSTAVQNAPVAPSNVQAVANKSGSQAVITWDPNPEPDIVGYEVSRGDAAGKNMTVIAQVKVSPSSAGTSYTDAPSKNGTYTYSVMADRYGPTYQTSVVSPGTSAPASVPLPNAATNPTTTTTTTKPGGGTTALPPILNSKPPSGHTSLKASPSVGGAIALPTSPSSVDPGFNPLLPYAQPQASDPGTTDPAVIAAPPIHKAGSNSVATLAAVGGGLLIAVIALHGLWLRSEVRRPAALEALDPDH